jgi:hypothetical protein
MSENINNLLPKTVEDRIVQLVFVAEVNIECCKVIYKYFKNKKETFSNLKYPENIMSHNRFLNEVESAYLNLSSHNHFCEAVSVVHSLLKTNTGRNKELSLKYYEKKYLNKSEGFDKIEFSSWLKEISGIYKKEKFADIRNKICDHKDIKNIGDPFTMVVLGFDNKWIDKLDQIIKDIKQGIFKFLREHRSNNYIMKCGDGLKKLLK